MALVILDSTTATAVNAATTQYDQLAALIASFGATVTVRILNSSDTLLSTETYGSWVISDNNPRELTLGTFSARTWSVNGTPAKCVFRAGVTDIFEMTAGVGSGDLSFVSTVKQLCKEDLSGMIIYAQNDLPIGAPPYPAWRTAAINEWAQISGTTCPAEIGSYSAAALRDDGTITEIACGVCGGHMPVANDTNRVMAIDLTVATPSWTQLKARGDFTGYEGDTMAYLVDGSPGPRHLYQGAIWSETLQSYLFSGYYYGTTASGGHKKTDGFSRTTNNYAAAGTYPDRPVNKLPWSVVDPSTGIIYATQEYEGVPGVGKQLNPNTLVITDWHPNTGANVAYGPNAWDTTRGVCFQLGGQTYDYWNPNLVSLTISPAGTKTAITFNSSTAYTAWTAAMTDTWVSGGGSTIYSKVLSPSMVYDEVDDVFYWYNGNDGAITTQANRVYKIIPNGTSVWDMEYIDGTGVTVPAQGGGGTYIGTCGTLFFVPRWGTLILVRPGHNIHYVRVR